MSEFSYFMTHNSRAWEGFFLLLEKFRRENRLIRIWGNHDELLALRPGAKGQSASEGFRFFYKNKTIFLFHGHQASLTFQRFNTWLGYLVRYLVHPLGIMNDSVAHDSRKKFKTERRVYEFSGAERIISIIGHTHRPLFESLSKGDTLRFRIEELCRRYPEAGEGDREEIGREIGAVKNELRRLLEKDGEDGFLGSIYDKHFTIPCIFNSGCATGKRGITCIEIENGHIRLVHWFDRNISKRYLLGDAYPKAEPLEDTDYFRVVIKEDDLDYIFTKIDLLA